MLNSLKFDLINLAKDRIFIYQQTFDVNQELSIQRRISFTTMHFDKLDDSPMFRKQVGYFLLHFFLPAIHQKCDNLNLRFSAGLVF